MVDPIFVCFVHVPRTLAFFLLLKVILKYFMYLFFREERGGRKRQKHQCVVASHAPPTGDLACNP